MMNHLLHGTATPCMYAPRGLAGGNVSVGIKTPKSKVCDTLEKQGVKPRPRKFSARPASLASVTALFAAVHANPPQNGYAKGARGKPFFTRRGDSSGLPVSLAQEHAIPHPPHQPSLPCPTPISTANQGRRAPCIIRARDPSSRTIHIIHIYIYYIYIYMYIYKYIYIYI